MFPNQISFSATAIGGETKLQQRQRKLLMPAFNFRHVKDLYPIFWSKSQEMVNNISKAIKSDPSGSSVIEIGSWSSRATLDIIGVAGVGKDFDALTNPDTELNETYRQIFERNTSASVDRRGSLRWNEFSHIKIPLPSLEEQKAIAEVLGTCDQELALLNRKLELLKKQKQGLMQQLLTGKIRVKT